MQDMREISEVFAELDQLSLTLEEVRRLYLANRVADAKVAGTALLERSDALPIATRIDLFLLLAQLERNQTSFDEALRYVLCALQCAEDIGDVRRQARARTAHAKILCRLGLTAEAMSESYAAVRLAGTDPDTLARALSPLGEVQIALGTLEAATQTYQKMLAIAHEAGDPELLALANRGLCCLCLMQHQMAREESASGSAIDATFLPRAMRHAADSEEQSHAAGCVHGVHLGRYLQAGALIESRDLAAARRKLDDMLLTLGEERSLYRAVALKKLGDLEFLEGEHQRSKSLLEEALALFESMGDQRQAADCCIALCGIFEAAGDFKTALSWHRRYFRSFERFSAESSRAHAAAMSIREEVDQARASAEAEKARADRLESNNKDLALEAEQSMRTAYEDGLTGIGNRRRFDKELRALTADRRNGQRRCIALLDVDHFKRVNDRFSHLVGDEVLRRLAGLLTQNARAGDIVTRYGGEEFALILLGLDAEQAVDACERVRLAVETADWSTVHPELRVTVSIGIGQFDEAAGDSDSGLLALVDQRLYEAKRRGRNRVVGPSACRLG